MADPDYFIERKPCESTVLRSYGYSAERQALVVELVDGRAFVFEGVPQAKYDGLEAAQSKGRFFGVAIKSKHSSRQIPPIGRCPDCHDQGVIGCKCEDCGCSNYEAEDGL